MKKEKILDMIMTQTNYTEEEALEKLKKWNYNTIFVIKDYLNPDFLKKKEEKSRGTPWPARSGKVRKAPIGTAAAYSRGHPD